MKHEIVGLSFHNLGDNVDRTSWGNTNSEKNSWQGLTLLLDVGSSLWKKEKEQMEKKNKVGFDA